MQPLIVALAAGTLWPRAAKVCIPDHDSSEGRFLHVRKQHVTRLEGAKVARARSVRRARQSNEDLCIPAGGASEMGYPLIEVVFAALASLIVVELDEQSIKGTLLDDGLHLEPSIAKMTFWRRRDEIVLARVHLG